jgi:hypothetical protein
LHERGIICCFRGPDIFKFARRAFWATRARTKRPHPPPPRCAAARVVPPALAPARAPFGTPPLLSAACCSLVGRAPGRCARLSTELKASTGPALCRGAPQAPPFPHPAPKGPMRLDPQAATSNTSSAVAPHAWPSGPLSPPVCGLSWTDAPLIAQQAGICPGPTPVSCLSGCTSPPTPRTPRGAQPAAPDPRGSSQRAAPPTPVLLPTDATGSHGQESLRFPKLPLRDGQEPTAPAAEIHFAGLSASGCRWPRPRERDPARLSERLEQAYAPWRGPLQVASAHLVSSTRCLGPPLPACLFATVRVWNGARRDRPEPLLPARSQERCSLPPLPGMEGCLAWPARAHHTLVCLCHRSSHAVTVFVRAYCHVGI